MTATTPHAVAGKRPRPASQPSTISSLDYLVIILVALAAAIFFVPPDLLPDAGEGLGASYGWERQPPGLCAQLREELLRALLSREAAEIYMRRWDFIVGGERRQRQERGNDSALELRGV